MDPTTDEFQQLLKRAAEGDSVAWRAVVEAFAPVRQTVPSVASSAGTLRPRACGWPYSTLMVSGVGAGCPATRGAESETTAVARVLGAAVSRGACAPREVTARRPMRPMARRIRDS